MYLSMECPEQPAAPNKKRGRTQTFGASETKAKGNLLQAAARHLERAGHTVGFTAAVSNRRRGMERGDSATAHDVIASALREVAESENRQWEMESRSDSAHDDLAESEKECRETESWAHAQLAENEKKCRGTESRFKTGEDVARQKEEQSQADIAQRREAEDHARQGDEEERLVAKQREVESKDAEIKLEMSRLRIRREKLEKKNSDICKAAGISVPIDPEPEEGIRTDSAEEKLHYERFQVDLLERRVESLRVILPESSVTSRR